MSHDYYTWIFVETSESEPLWIAVDEALTTLGWTASPVSASTGLRSYVAPNRVLDMGLWSWPEGETPRAVVASCLDRVARGPGMGHVLHALTEIHLALGALRTLWGWELGETVPFDPAAEHARLCAGVLQDEYWLDITRAALTPQERIEALTERVRGTRSTFHRLPNRDWSFRGPVDLLPGAVT